MSNPQRQNGSGCCGARANSRTAGFTCLPNWLFGEATAQELVVLLALQHHAPNIRPSLAMLARESGLSKRSVQNVLGGLEEKGWLAKEQATDSFGRKAPNSYQLLIWGDARRMAGGAIWQEKSVDMAPGATKQEEDNKKRNPTALEPPNPQRGERRPLAVAIGPCQGEGQGSDRDRDGFLISRPSQPEQPPAEPVAVQPQPRQPQTPRPLPEPAPEAVPHAPVKPKARKPRAGVFRPEEGDVPAALLPVVRELLAFWPARRGAKTTGAWELLCRELQRIQDHPQGGTEIVRGQLEQGVMAGIDGRAWQSIRFSNWERYGTKAGTPIIGTGFGGKRSTMDRVMGAIALVEERERKAAAAEQVNRGELVLAGVA